MMGNHANKRAAAAAHNARYADREAVRPNIAKVDRFKGVNIGAVGEVDSGLKRKPIEATNVKLNINGKTFNALNGSVSMTWKDKKPSLFQRFAAYLKTKLIGR